jgi:hypothetical protein
VPAVWSRRSLQYQSVPRASLPSAQRHGAAQLFDAEFFVALDQRITARDAVMFCERIHFACTWAGRICRAHQNTNPSAPSRSTHLDYDLDPIGIACAKTD